MADYKTELLNSVYKEIADSLGMDTAISIYKLFKGQQICFPVRLYNNIAIRNIIACEYNGKNIRSLAIKYNYSEKTIRRIINNNKIEENEK